MESSWPPSTMQKGIRLNDGHVASLGLLARKDGTRKGYLSKRSSDNTKWQTKWFALLQNLLFYFESDSSSRPSGLYLLEGCVCDRAPSPKPTLSAKEPLEKQVSEASPGAPGLLPAEGARTLFSLLSAPSERWEGWPKRAVTRGGQRGRDCRQGAGVGCGCPAPGELGRRRAQSGRDVEVRRETRFGESWGFSGQTETMNRSTSSQKWCSQPREPRTR